MPSVVTPTRAADLAVDDVIDIVPALEWLREHAEMPVDTILLAMDIAAFGDAVITDVRRHTHAVTNEPVVILYNTVHDIVVPEFLSIPRITA
ncbi:hypothetical protein GS896_27670 [Rhodococcus hoagii]|nr:hypothetical protein [Prescottella equi]MBM4654032.1 hypothetical protein [Prescottella equi]MBM4719705.1 hypothetical protein [Prescottella equi]NKR23502.1 hypothetical protein [Prescottella equi]NKT56344.1 hypothetical protein [Prescottella equi]